MNISPSSESNNTTKMQTITEESIQMMINESINHENHEEYMTMNEERLE